MENGASRVEDGLGSDLRSVEVLSRLDLNRELDIKADKVALLRDDHDGASVGRVNGATRSDIGLCAKRPISMCFVEEGEGRWLTKLVKGIASSTPQT